MTHRSLEDLLQNIPSTVDMLRNAQVGPNVYPGVPAEYTNWRDEQWAWQNTCVLFNQSYHMADLAVTGPDAMALLSHLGVNTFENFAVDKAKQFVPCTPAGYVIGDVILFHLAEQEFNLVGRAPVLNWVTYHAQTGDYDVEVTLDQRSALRTDGRRKSFRFQLQGPNAMDVIGGALGAEPPELKFFNLTATDIGGVKVRALRHGMVGQPGWELFGPWADYEAVALGARRGRSAVWAAAGGGSGLFLERTRIGLDSVSPARRLHRRRTAFLPRMAARHRVRGLGLDRGQLRLRRHRALLLHALGSRLRPSGEVRPRLHRP